MSVGCSQCSITLQRPQNLTATATHIMKILTVRVIRTQAAKISHNHKGLAVPGSQQRWLDAQVIRSVTRRSGGPPRHLHLHVAEGGPYRAHTDGFALRELVVDSLSTNASLTLSVIMLNQLFVDTFFSACDLRRISPVHYNVCVVTSTSCWIATGETYTFDHSARVLA